MCPYSTIWGHSVAAAGRGGQATIADACAHAWLRLARRPQIPRDARGFNWLAAGALDEAWRLSDPRERPAGPFVAEPQDDGEFREPSGLADDPREHVIAAVHHRERVARFARLGVRERRDLLLLAGGYRYHEIAALTHGG